MPPSSAALAAEPKPVASLVDPALQHQIEQFLYEEAALLDTHDYDAWSDLLADDLHYVMPLRTTRPTREAAKALSGPTEIAYFDDGKASMALRIRKLKTSSAWAEDPPSRTRHFVSNVRIRPSRDAGEYDVSLAFMVYRNRAETQIDLFAGERVDRLRRAACPLGFKIARRRILIDQSTLTANNISFFF